MTLTASPVILLKRFAGRLRFPTLFLLTAAVFVADLFFPDAIPLVDEILLGLATALLGSWKRRSGGKDEHGDAEDGDGSVERTGPRA